MSVLFKMMALAYFGGNVWAEILDANETPEG